MARLLIVQDSGLNESLAVTELAALLARHGHRCRLILTRSEADPAAAITAWEPDVVLVPFPVTGHVQALADATLARRAAPSALLVVAGTHVTFDSSPAKERVVDVVLRGEAELPMVALLEAVERGRDWQGIAGLAWRDGGNVVENHLHDVIRDLDELPLPDRELYYRYRFMARFPWKKFSSGRGCFHRCSFCWNSTLADMMKADGRDRGSFVRRKSPARAAEELRVVRDRHPLRQAHFSDDLFTSSVDWLESFADVFPERVGVPFTCNSSIELITPRTVAALAKAGCQGVAIGVETANEDLRQRILNKRVTNADVREAAGLIKGAGLELITYNMLGAPGETIEDALQTVALNRDIGTDHMRITMSVPVPNTSFEAAAFSSGHLATDAERVGRLTSPDTPFASDERQAFRNLYFLFRLMVRHPELEGMCRRLLRLPSEAPLLPLRALAPLTEKRINRVGWVEGLRYFRHVGDPRGKTANYVTLV